MKADLGKNQVTQSTDFGDQREDKSANEGSSNSCGKFWSNWIPLGLCAMVSFSIGNILIAELSSLGIAATRYFGAGAFIFSVIFFSVRKECTLRNNPADRDNPAIKKVLTRTWDNKVDYCAAFVVLIGAIFQFAIFSSIIFSFE